MSLLESHPENRPVLQEKEGPQVLNALVVDDEPSVRAVVKHALEALGHKVRVVHDGREALQLILKERFDLVVTDWEMPGIDGLDLSRRIREVRLPGYTYVIILSVRRGKTNLMRGLSAGADDFMAKPFDREELRVRLHTAERILKLESQLSRANDELRGLNEGLLKKSRIDPLMGINNRLAFEEQFSQFHDICVERDVAYGIVMCDVDHFKRLNDRFGHQYGDEVLRQLARIIRSSLRNEDLAFRYGGEEILLLLYRQQLGGAERAADRIRQKIASVPFPMPGTELSAHVTISCGVASYPENFDTTTGWMGLVGSADQALYKAKNAGRNRVMTAEPYESASKTA